MYHWGEGLHADPIFLHLETERNINSTPRIKGEGGKEYDIFIFYDLFLQESIVHLESREREERNMTSLSFMTFFYRNQ